jgi:hypothetical protein
MEHKNPIILEEQIEKAIEEDNIPPDYFYDEEDFNNYKSFCKNMALVAIQFKTIVNQMNVIIAQEYNNNLPGIFSNLLPSIDLMFVEKMSSKYQVLEPLLTFFEKESVFIQSMIDYKNKSNKSMKMENNIHDFKDHFNDLCLKVRIYQINHKTTCKNELCLLENPICEYSFETVSEIKKYNELAINKRYKDIFKNFSEKGE